jgi:glycosyltransferase involved in cell wall biosynthesis
VPNGVDLEYFRPLDRPPDPNTIVFSGKMSYHANVTAALYFVQHIFPLIRASKPAARLRIVGSNPPHAIQALPADPNIEVTGHVADLRQYVGSANVAVCPVTVKVGIQNKLLEAMAMGVPIVSTELGMEGLSTTAGQELLVGRHPAEFAAHVVQLFDDSSLARRMGAAGRHYVERHHRWAGAAEAFEREYAAAIGQWRAVS